MSSVVLRLCPIAAITLALVACGGSSSSDQGSASGGERTRPKLELTPAEGGDHKGSPGIQPGHMKGSDGEGPAFDESQCDQVPPGDAPADGCFTGVLKCGDEIVGNTAGGAQVLNTRFYEKNFCTPATTNHDAGGERIYKFSLPEGDHVAWITLETPCTDLDLFAIKAGHDHCPTMGTQIGQCEGSVWNGHDKDKVRLASRGASDWVVVVEGKRGDGAFGLKVECHDGLQ